MVPSEELELGVFRFAESTGKARWLPTDLVTLRNALQFMEDAVLVDALHDLHARVFMEFRQWSYPQNRWVPYAGADREYFYHDFEMRVTFSGRKYFELLESQAAGADRSATDATRHARPQVGADGSTLHSRKDSSPQQVLAPEWSNPKAFVSYGAQDRPFVERFAGDLRKYGVDAWCSVWEIKPGDSIRAKIDQALEECDFFIIVLSRATVSRRWVQVELDAATARRAGAELRKIIPIKLDDCSNLPPTIRALCWEDFSSQPYDSALRRVLDSIFDVDVRPPLGNRPSAAKPPNLTPPIIVPPTQKGEPST